MKAIIFFLIIFNSLSVLADSKPNRKINIVFRYDDFKLESDVFNDSLLNVFRNNKISLCIGIVPYDSKGMIHSDLKQQQLDILKDRIEKNEIEIALHGFNHNNNAIISSFRTPNPSEFNDLNFHEQYIKIKSGKKALDSILNTNVKIFIPPFNSYNVNTLFALDSLKFEIISANLQGISGSDKISYMPFTLGNLYELPKIIDSDQSDNFTIVVMLHPFSFNGGGTDSVRISDPIYFKQLDTILKWINNQKNLTVTNFSKLSRCEIFDEYRFRLNSKNNSIILSILEKLKVYRYGTYNTTRFLRTQNAIIGVLNVIFFVIIFSGSFLAFRLYSKQIKPFKTLRVLFITIFVIGIICILYKGYNSFNFITYLILIATVSVAFILSNFTETRILSKPL